MDEVEEFLTWLQETHNIIYSVNKKGEDSYNLCEGKTIILKKITLKDLILSCRLMKIFLEERRKRLTIDSV